MQLSIQSPSGAVTQDYRRNSSRRSTSIEETRVQFHLTPSIMSEANICGRRVKIAREKHGWQQVDLAAALNLDFSLRLDQSDISEIERGVRSIKDFELDALALALNESPLWLLRGDPQ